VAFRTKKEDKNKGEELWFGDYIYNNWNIGNVRFSIIPLFLCAIIVVHRILDYKFYDFWFFRR